MKSNPNSNLYLYEVLLEAINAGYTKDFIVHANGNIYYYGNSDKFYAVHEISYVPILCPGSSATLYLLTATDGERGTLVEHWEC